MNNEAIDLPIAVLGAGGSTDADFAVSDDADTTKKLAFQVSNVSSETTRTWRVPNANGILPANPLSNTNVCVGSVEYSFVGGEYDSDDDGHYNTFTGYDSGINTTSGAYNTGAGYIALNSNTTGFGNSAFGANTLESNTEGDSNCAFGRRALQYNTIGYDNCAYGRNTLRSNYEGYNNTSYGNYSLRNNNTGHNNAAFGLEALNQCVEGTYNTAVGTSALFSNNGNYNTSVGFQALNDNSAGNNNSALGALARTDIYTRNGCIVLGHDAVSRDVDNTITIGNETVRAAIVEPVGAYAITHVVSIKIGDVVYKLMASDGIV